VSVEADEGTRRTIALAAPLDVVRTTEPLRHGPHDPSCRVVDGVVWRAWRSPAGPATIRLVTHPDRVEATAWGEGAGAALEVSVLPTGGAPARKVFGAGVGAGVGAGLGAGAGSSSSEVPSSMVTGGPAITPELGG